MKSLSLSYDGYNYVMLSSQGFFGIVVIMSDLGYCDYATTVCISQNTKYDQ